MNEQQWKSFSLELCKLAGIQTSASKAPRAPSVKGPIAPKAAKLQVPAPPSPPSTGVDISKSASPAGSILGAKASKLLHIGVPLAGLIGGLYLHHKMKKKERAAKRRGGLPMYEPPPLQEF